MGPAARWLGTGGRRGGVAELVRDAIPKRHGPPDRIDPADIDETPLRDETKLNPDFVRLRTEEVFSPARDIIEPMMR